MKNAITILTFVEINSVAVSTVVNNSFSVSDATIKDGATPSTPIAGTTIGGKVWPENISVEITVGRDGNTWRPIVTNVTGNYSYQINMYLNEVTGPGSGGNTTSQTIAERQVYDLSRHDGTNSHGWWMRAALVAHENVHVSRFEPALENTAGSRNVVPKLETEIESLSLLSTISFTQAIKAFKSLPDYINAIEGPLGAYLQWRNNINKLTANDHKGPTESAERKITDPMIIKIKAAFPDGNY